MKTKGRRQSTNVRDERSPKYRLSPAEAAQGSADRREDAEHYSRAVEEMNRSRSFPSPSIAKGQIMREIKGIMKDGIFSEKKARVRKK